MTFLYDGSFEGFLSVVFECYSRKITPENICSKELLQYSFFGENQYISSCPENADRVWKGWQKKLSKPLKQLPFLAFLSGETGMEMKLFRFARLSFASEIPIDTNFGDPEILEIRKASRRVTQEALRMIQFVRFQETRDGIFFSGMRPRYDVLPMTLNHFRDRFADQPWLIYDMKRDYGYFYDQNTIEEITLNEKNFNTIDGKLSTQVLMEEEASYQTLWNQYYKSITIRERLNLKCHKNHLPKRYWKYLTEKKGLKN